MRRGKYIGFFAIAIGFILMVGAAVLPVSPVGERLGPFRVESFRVDLGGDTCGPAALVAFDEGENGPCRSAAQRRLLSMTGLGMVLVALGMALFAGGDERRGSMVEVSTPRAPRRRAGRRGVNLHRPL